MHILQQRRQRRWHLRGTIQRRSLQESRAFGQSYHCFVSFLQPPLSTIITVRVLPSSQPTRGCMGYFCLRRGAAFWIIFILVCLIPLWVFLGAYCTCISQKAKQGRSPTGIAWCSCCAVFWILVVLLSPFLLSWYWGAFFSKPAHPSQPASLFFSPSLSLLLAWYPVAHASP